jgi:hypothetical protein
MGSTLLCEMRCRHLTSAHQEGTRIGPLIEAGRRDLNVVDGQCGAWLVTPEMRRQRVQPASPWSRHDFRFLYGVRRTSRACARTAWKNRAPFLFLSTLDRRVVTRTFATFCYFWCRLTPASDVAEWWAGDQGFVRGGPPPPTFSSRAGRDPSARWQRLQLDIEIGGLSLLSA